MLASHWALWTSTGSDAMSVFQTLSDGKIPHGTPGGALAWAGIAVTGVRAPQHTTSSAVTRIGRSAHQACTNGRPDTGGIGQLTRLLDLAPRQSSATATL